MSDRNQQKEGIGFLGPITRRQALKDLVFGGLSFRFAPKLSSQDAPREGNYSGPETITILEGEAEKRLQQAGLGDYSNLFIKTQRFVQTYATTIFPEVFYVLNDVVSKDPTDLDKDFELKSKIEWLKSGWGEKFDQSTADALVKIKNVDIDTSQTYDSRENVEKLLLPLAQHFPAFIHALPDKIVMVPSGGYCGVTEVGLTSSKSPGAFVTLMHELTHAAKIYPDRIKPYVTKEHFIAYLEAQLEAVQTTCDMVFSSNLQSALTIKNDGPWLLLHISADLTARQQQLDKIKLYESRFFPNSIIPQEHEDNYSYRFTRVAHQVGSKLYEIHQKQLRGDKLTLTELGLFSEPLLFDLMDEVIGEVDHYYTGPLQQKNGGGLPISDTQVAAGFIDHINGALEVQRLMSFSKYRIPNVVRSTTLAEIFGLMPGDTEQNETETVEQFPFHESLVTFGAISLGKMEFEFSEILKSCRLYELPVNPHATDTVALFLYFHDLSFLGRGKDKEHGFVISVPKSAWDKDLDLKKRSSSINMAKDGSGVISFKTNKDSKLEMVYTPGIGVQQTTWKDIDASVTDPQACSVAIQPTAVREFVATNMLLRTGDLNTQKETSMETALCLQTGSKLRVFPCHQNEILRSYLKLLGLQRGGVVLGRDMREKCFALPEMIPVLYNVSELTKVPDSFNYILQPLDEMSLQPEDVHPILLKFTPAQSTEIARILSEYSNLYINLQPHFINTGVEETRYILHILNGETNQVLDLFITQDVEWIK